MNKFFKTVFLFVSMTFLCCIITNNTSAINLLDSRQPNKIEYQFTGQSTYQSVDIRYNVIDHLYFSPSAQNQQYMYNFRLYFPSYTIEDKTKFKFTIYFQTEVENNTTYFSSPICPRNSGSQYLTIDDCIVENLDKETYIAYIDQYPNSSGTYPYTYFPNNTNIMYYSMTITGHRSGNSASIERFLTQGPFFFVYNTNPTSTPLSVDLTLRMYFGRIIFYTEDDNPQDEAAEKELQDRDNIESQQSSTDSGAESSSQDFGAATTNISGVISTFISNLNNLNANNCTLPEIAAYGFSIGRINLCTYSPPNWIQGVTTAIISLITLRLAWHLFKRIMGIAKGLAGSK